MGCIMLTGWGTVTSWSSWRSFTVTLFWSSGRVPLGKTPSLVITTGWRTLKSRAMANASDGMRTEGSGTDTISISASCPVTRAEGGRAVAQAYIKFIKPTRWSCRFSGEDRVVRWGKGQSEKNQTLLKHHHQQFEELVLGTAVFKWASVCEHGFLITKEQFITQEINETIKAVRGKEAFYFICIVHNFCCLLQKQTIRGEEPDKERAAFYQTKCFAHWPNGTEL